MSAAPLPENEAQRHASLHSLQILDTLPEERFERITRIAQRLFDVPIASITLVDANRQWFKSCLGLAFTETSRDIAFCAHAILSDDVLVIPDTLLDPRFSDNPLVTGDPYIRFYAGQPLKGPDGYNVGTLCIIDDRPRQMSSADLQSLRDLSHWAENELNAVELQQALETQRKAEQELQNLYRQADHARSEARAILDATSEAIVLISPERRFLTIDRQFTEFFGLASQAVLGKRFDDLQDIVTSTFVDPDAFRSLIAGTANDAQRQFTAIVVQQSPQRRELELYSTPVHTTNAEFLGRLYVFRDVTHEREIDRMKSEFVSLVSHELRTPLTSIKGYIDLILDGDAGEITEEQQEYLEIARNNADRLVALINDLLDVSRIESGKVELQRRALDMAHVIQDVASSLRPQIDAKGQHLSLIVHKPLPTILGDADRVTQILNNLLSNAYKYTPAGGSISIEAQAVADKHVRVDVRDSGIGLTPDEMGKLFTRFFRAKNKTTQEVGGTGLGLTITRSLVEMHGGEITVTSTPGQGSTFSFTLPTTQEPVKQEAIDPQITTVRTGGCILVVDDEPDIANLIRRYLEHDSYTVLVAHDATEALNIARNEHPDLITLDIMLPDADGFTVLEWLKSDSITARIPVVLLSMMDDGQRGKLLGAVDYLRKPVQERVLLERVKLILAQDQLQGHLVLVADDDNDLRSLIAGNLRRAGYQVIEAASGEEAVALAQSGSPALALIDIKMPGMDGVAVLRALRINEATRNLPVIMMTASPGTLEESRSVVEALGGATLLSKPCTAEELARAISQRPA